MLLQLKKHAPRWVIFLIDILICTVALFLAYLLRFNFEIPKEEFNRFYLAFPVVLIVRGFTFLIARTYAGIVRYTSTKDGERILLTLISGSVIFGIINIMTYKFWDKHFIIPFSIIIIEFLITSFAMIASRVIVKMLYAEITNPTKEKEKVLIFGAGEAGIITKRTLDRDAGTKYKVIAFIDDDKKKSGKKIEGIDIENTDKLGSILNDEKITTLIIAIQQIDKKKLNDITEICLKHGVKIKHIPPVYNWINGELSYNQIRHVKIEELLGREPINLEKSLVKKQLANKVILVTGAAGSIGSELCRQIIQFNPKKLIVLDQAESPLYELEFELNNRHKGKFESVIADITNKERLGNVFKTFKPQIIYHAAAYKHVPLMEDNPSEAIYTNVQGTKFLADLAIEHNVEKFVMISTDKAVNPTNVMGASKRIAEIYTQSLNHKSNTAFVTTRFGNVLGSNGSVIPIFKKQIETGGPLTVTHPDITRFFMTIPEACSLVLEAGSFGKGGEIFIFDMGKSVKIVDLAKKMIKLSGLSLGKDIQIVFTGLRPGEKICEELLNDKETTIPTHHPQIMTAKVREYPFEEIKEKIAALIHLFETQDNKVIVRAMKEIVPEYKSNNSVFQELDK